VKQQDEAQQRLRKRPQPGRVRAIILAVAVHAAFIALIVFGVRWQSMPTPPVVAELWDKLPAQQKAAPPPPEPTPPTPEPVKPPPKPPEPEPEVKPPPKPPDAEIAEKAEREKRAREEAQRIEEEREEKARQKAAREKAAKEKKQQEEAARKKLEQDRLAKEKREEEQRRKEEQKRLAEAEQARAAAATARQQEMQQWIDKIRAKILSRANVPDTVATGTELTVHIRILPGGDVLDITVTNSTSPTYSAAIERAIRSAQPLPVPDPNSELFPQFRDLNLNFRHER
jgi:colicin import membrane protein